MKKILILVVALLPLVGIAQLGNILKVPDIDTDEVEGFVDQVGNFESKMDSSGNLLYSSTDAFFTIVDSVTDLPTMTELWEGVKDDLESAINEEKEELAQEGFVQYVQETDERKDALDELWQDNTVRTEIINHLVGQKDNLAPIMENLEAALTLDKEALGTYDEIFTEGNEAVTDLGKQIAEKPAAALKAKPVLEEGKEALEDLKNIKEVGEQHIELATYIIDKIKTAIQ